MNKIQRLREIEKTVIDGKMASKEDLIFISKLEEKYLKEILSISKTIKDKYIGKRISLCSIVSGNVGACSEDCKFCAQSSHYNTGIEKKDIPEFEEIKKLALECQKYSIKRFSIVSSGKKVNTKDLEKTISYYEKLYKETKLNLCASLGILSLEELKKLKNSGVQMYHHNIETSENYYKYICTTHKFKDRIDTIRNAKKVGLKVCSGGILGLGESFEDRIDFILKLREEKVDSIPINILDPIKGTPLENIKRLDPKEILKSILIFRIAYPNVELRLAGGRKYIKEYQELGLEVAIDGILTGNYLTTVGNNIDEDLEMIKNYNII